MISSSSTSASGHHITKTSKIVHILWEKYGLYKLRSDEEQPHSLNRSMYIGLIKEGGKIIS